MDEELENIAEKYGWSFKYYYDDGGSATLCGYTEIPASLLHPKGGYLPRYNIDRPIGIC